MAKQKIVLKVRYQDQEPVARKAGLNRRPEVITVWNYRRIAAAGITLLLLTCSVAFYLTGGDPETPETSAAAAGNPLLIDDARDTGADMAEPWAGKSVSAPREAVPEAGKAVDSAGAGQETGTGKAAPEVVESSLALQEADKPMTPAADSASANVQYPPDPVVEPAALMTAEADAGVSGQKTLPATAKENAPVAAGATESRTERDSVEVSSHLRRSQLTTRVVRREPVDRVQGPLHAVEGRAFQLCLFTELQGLQGQKVTHRWSLNGQEVFSKHFQVRGDRWRVYSSKLLNRKMIGVWKVEVIAGGSDELLDRQQFELLPPS